VSSESLVVTMHPREIRLTDVEVRLAQEWSVAKQKFKRSHHVKDQWYDRNSNSASVDLMGRLGEIAACRALDLDWSTVLDWEIRPEGDSGIDFVAYGYRWDVKTSTLSDLIFNSTEHFKAEVALLVQLVGDRKKPEDAASIWRVWGVCSQAKFQRDCVEHVYDERKRVKVTNDKLVSVDEFFAHLGAGVGNVRTPLKDSLTGIQEGSNE
jgi:hypothetical protein